MKSDYKISGFSIPEVVVVAGLLSGVALGITKLTELSQREQRHHEENFNIKDESRKIINILSDPASCAQNLVGHKLGDVLSEIVALKSDGNVVSFPELKVGATLQGGGVSLISYKISKLKITSGKGTGEIEVIYDRKGRGLRTEDISDHIGFIAQVDGSNKITSCVVSDGEDETLDSVCGMIGGVYNTTTEDCEIDPSKFLLLAQDGTQKSLQEELCKREKWHILIFGGKSIFCNPPVNASKCNWGGWYNFGSGYPSMNCSSGEIIERQAWVKP